MSTDERRRRLADAVKAYRAARPWYTHDRIRQEGGPSGPTITAIEAGDIVKPFSIRRLEAALGWPEGRAAEVADGRIDIRWFDESAPVIVEPSGLEGFSEYDLAMELARRLAPTTTSDETNVSAFDRPPRPNVFAEPETEASRQAPDDGGYWRSDKRIPEDLPAAAAEGHGGEEDPVRRRKRELDEAGEESQDDGGAE
ncbi:hypothetical protein EK0264_03555 [Epidermidibacterium keratini]|uniref:Helix-turn-helix domain-containing protein n=1 Tax=Epidermidibacterium keratini TaxID=1891644 RepID=A0A7L4YJP2_9ACTN|nr:hypothetical protein [Epidermidibacterium keratini]QHB99445.1 hypothetical protein EK0264_03555 [Epidermidibacterium keratini]